MDALARAISGGTHMILTFIIAFILGGCIGVVCSGLMLASRNLRESWIPIKDYQPALGQRVLINQLGQVNIARYIKWTGTDETVWLLNATTFIDIEDEDCWMPLPPI